MGWRIWPPANEYQSAANSPPASQPVHTGQPDRRARLHFQQFTPSAPQPHPHRRQSSAWSPIPLAPHPPGVETWGAADAVDTGSRPSRRNPTPHGLKDSSSRPPLPAVTPQGLHHRLPGLARASRHFSPPVPQAAPPSPLAYTGNVHVRHGIRRASRPEMLRYRVPP